VSAEREEAPMVLVPRNVFSAIETAIRQRHILYIDSATADAGLQNIIVWGHPDADDYIILVAGES
jgi:hypothetical protein